MASDGDSALEDIETYAPATETATATAPIAVNGPRKSSARRFKKKPLVSVTFIFEFLDCLGLIYA